MNNLNPTAEEWFQKGVAAHEKFVRSFREAQRAAYSMELADQNQEELRERLLTTNPDNPAVAQEIMTKFYESLEA